ncbi:hypothetical protein [Cupriavidus necator]|uniref:hypothetical protein n=1 Tax=Cupriavidus necator TaxID=106590 RepID=UPI00339D4ACA
MSEHESEHRGGVANLWNSTDEQEWLCAETIGYWECVGRANIGLEREMERLDPQAIAGLDAHAWYEFLLNKYFRWKYTAANRYGSTTKFLRRHGQYPELG